MLVRIARQIVVAATIVALAAVAGVLSSTSVLAHGAHDHGLHRVSASQAAVSHERGGDKLQLDQATARSHASPQADAVVSGAGHEIRVAVASASHGGCNFEGGHALGMSCCGHACHGGALSVDEGTHQPLPRPQRLAPQQAVIFWAEVRFGLMRPPRA